MAPDVKGPSHVDWNHSRSFVNQTVEESMLYVLVDLGQVEGDEAVLPICPLCHI